MLDRDKLQKTLRNHESIDLIDLSSLMDISVEELLIGIQDEIMEEFNVWFNKTAYKIPLFSKKKVMEYFSIQIVDIGFLCQHVIKDFKKSIKNKYARLVYFTYIKKWLINRGY